MSETVKLKARETARALLADEARWFTVGNHECVKLPKTGNSVESDMVVIEEARGILRGLQNVPSVFPTLYFASNLPEYKGQYTAENDMAIIVCLPETHAKYVENHARELR